MPSETCVISRNSGTAINLRQQMVRLRVLQERLQAMCDAGECTADLHLGIGQEAIPVGVCAALQPQDLLLVHHRMIGWAVAKGVPVGPLVAELLGRETGLAQGRAGEMHLRLPEYGLMHTFQLVGTVVSVAAGVAWAVKNYQKGDGIVVAVCGDAATANGQFHEGMNIAAVQHLPLLLVVENNGVAGNVAWEHYLPERNIRAVLQDRGLTFTINGNDVTLVHEATDEARRYILDEGRLALLDCHTQRLGKHKQGMGDLRSKEEMARLWAQDPLRDMTVEERQIAEAEVDRMLATL